MTSRSRTRKIAAVLLALVVAIGAAGCGGGSDRLSKSDYEAKLKSISTSLQAISTAFQGNNSSIGAVEAKMATAQAKLQAAATSLSKLKPPKDAEGDNKKLSNALSALARSVNNVKQALAAKNLAQVGANVRALQSSPAIQDARDATQDLQKKGYKVG
jgi:chromosome segregation ATPase